MKAFATCSYRNIVLIAVTCLVFPGYPMQAARGSLKAPAASIEPCSTSIDPQLSTIDGVRRFATDHSSNKPASSKPTSSKPVFFKINVSQSDPVGTQCASTAGIVFLRIRDAAHETGWKDTGPGGRIWYDELAAPVNRGQAGKFCAKKNQRLPNDQELRLASEHGFGEVLKSAKKIYAIWSSTTESLGLGNGHVLNDLDAGTMISISRSLATGDGDPGGPKLGAICVDR